MRFHAPKDVYGPNLLRLFVEELGGAKTVHKHLGVSERTMYHWLSSGRVPRAAVLALFWETQYGRGHIYADQVNEIRQLYAQVCLLREQYQRAKDIITGLRALHAGSANEPLFAELAEWSILRPPRFGTQEDADRLAKSVMQAQQEDRHLAEQAVALVR